MKVKKQKKGISLIVLVITIIVMIILAATVIIFLSNNGIIDKANEAVEKTNEKQYNELATLAWADAYADGKRTQAELLTAVKTRLEENNVDLTKYRLVVTEKGASITYTNGEVLPQIGDTVAYDCYTGVDSSKLTYTATKSETGKDNDQTFTVTEKDKTRKWQVLGINDGVITLTTDADISFEWTSTECEESTWTFYVYENFPFDTICGMYGYGKGATKARSITVEDINKVTGLNTQLGYTKEEIEANDIRDGEYIGKYYTYNFSNTTYKDLLRGDYFVCPIFSLAKYWKDDETFYYNESNWYVKYGYAVSGYDLKLSSLVHWETGDDHWGSDFNSFIRPVVELQTNVTLVDTNYDGVWEIQL